MNNHSCGLQALDLSGNTIKDAGIKDLARGLVRVPLIRLRLSDCGLRNKGLSALLSALTRTDSAPRLQILDLSHNRLSNSGSKVFFFFFWLWRRLVAGMRASWLPCCAPGYSVATSPPSPTLSLSFQSVMVTCPELPPPFCPL